MTEQQHPITPPPELVQQWIKKYGNSEDPRWQSYEQDIATQAARWGADQELDACCEVLARELICDGKHVATDLRAVRRPKPPSLKEQALALVNGCTDPHGDHLDDAALDTIRRALEALPDD